MSNAAVISDINLTVNECTIQVIGIINKDDITKPEQSKRVTKKKVSVLSVVEKELDALLNEPLKG